MITQVKLTMMTSVSISGEGIQVTRANVTFDFVLEEESDGSIDIGEIRCTVNGVYKTKLITTWTGGFTFERTNTCALLICNEDKESGYDLEIEDECYAIEAALLQMGVNLDKHIHKAQVQVQVQVQVQAQARRVVGL